MPQDTENLSRHPDKPYPAVAASGDPVLALAGLGKRFGADYWLFRGLNLQIFAGQSVSLQGESGSGKSTLLNLIAGIEAVSEGDIWVAGQAVHRLADGAAAQLRARQIGFVFQAFHLLPNLPVWRNIALPLFLNGASLAQARSLVRQALDELDLRRIENASPADLSGGEQQRVALLRALIHRPKLLLADEPTGNLDPDNAQRALRLLVDQARAGGAALLMVTHSRQAASICQRHLRLASADQSGNSGPAGLIELAAGSL